jgi:hypothetical protein
LRLTPDFGGPKIFHSTKFKEPVIGTEASRTTNIHTAMLVPLMVADREYTEGTIFSDVKIVTSLINVRLLVQELSGDTYTIISLSHLMK